MNLNRKQINRLIDILELYGGMFGCESQEINELIMGIKDYQVIEKKRTKEEVIEAIIRQVSDATNIPIEVMKSKSREREIVIARQMCFFLIKEYFEENITWSRLASVFKQNHATAIHSVNLIRNCIETKDKLVMDLLDQLNVEHLNQAA